MALMLMIMAAVVIMVMTSVVGHPFNGDNKDDG